MLRKNNIEEKEINKVIKSISEYFGNKVEVEKKYCFNEISNPKDEFKEISKLLKLANPAHIQNIDTYYEDNLGILDENNISIRKRVTNNKEEWTIKRLLEDNTSILKREELNFSGKEQVIYYLKNNFNLSITNLNEKITLHTKRAKYDKELCDGLFEIVFDKTTSEVNVETKTSYMLECKLKKGKSKGLYFINKVISSFPSIYETNLSKKDIVLKSLDKTDKIKVKAQ